MCRGGRGCHVVERADSEATAGPHLTGTPRPCGPGHVSGTKAPIVERSLSNANGYSLFDKAAGVETLPQTSVVEAL